MTWLDGIMDTTDMSLSELREMLEGGEAWPAAVHGAAKSWKQLSNRTTATSQAGDHPDSTPLFRTRLSLPSRHSLFNGWHSEYEDGVNTEHK